MAPTLTTLDEKEYRGLVAEAYRQLERAFDAVDPDLAEFELSQGAVSIQFANRTKLILSTQPSVRQLWLAAASKGIAYHFDFDPESKSWLDDKGKGLELLATVKALVAEVAGVSLAL